MATTDNTKEAALADIVDQAVGYTWTLLKMWQQSTAAAIVYPPPSAPQISVSDANLTFGQIE